MRNAAIQPTDRVELNRDAHVEQSRRYFDPYLTCNIATVRTLAQNIIAARRYILDPQTRKRQLRKVDEANREEVIRAVFANLAFAVVSGFEPPTIGISFRTAKQGRTRYDREGFRTLPAVVESLAGGAGMEAALALHKSNNRGQPSTITAAPWLVDLIRPLKRKPDDFGQATGAETIILTRVDRDYAGGREHREYIDYETTPETERYRSEMAKINATIRGADIAFKDDGASPVIVGGSRLRRYFNLPATEPQGAERFDLGGRMFGAWWSDLPKTRRPSIRIEGERVADLDFASMFLRLAYAEAGHAPPDGDLYAGIPGLTETRYRPGVKRVASAMLFRTEPLTRAPRGTRDDLPEGMTGRRLRSAILARHPLLAGVFETGIGLRLMFLESQILVTALLALADAGVPALPMHDGLMVARSKTAVAERTMGDAAEAVCGYRLPISLKML